MSKFDPIKAQEVVGAVQREIEQEMADFLRQAQSRRYQRIFHLGYQTAERDYQVGPHAPISPYAPKPEPK